MVNNGVNWYFIIERAPWKGPYERLIGPIKYCLNRVAAKSTKLNLDEVRTLMSEIAKIVNERPVTFRSERELFKPIRPIDLLLPWKEHSTVPTLNPEVLVCEEEYQPGNDAALRLEKQLLASRKQLEKFRKSWMNHYLLSLRERSCSTQPTKSCLSPSVGDVVIVYDPDHARKYWRLAKIIELHSDIKGVVRSARINMGGTITNRSISHLYLLEMHENQDNISLANLTNISVTDRMDGVYLYEDDMEEMQEERHETTGGIILTEWGWNDRCDPGETGHENCERVVLGDLLPRRPVRIREKIRLQPMDNIVNTQQPFAATTLLLLAIFQAVCRSDLRNLVLVFLRDANLERRNVLMLWRHFANEHFRWSRRNPPLMKDEDWTHVVSVRRKCKVAEAALGQHLVRPAHLPEFRNFDWQHIDFTASAEVRLTTEEFCNRHHRFLQTAINIQRHELFYGRQPTLRATANIMIMGDSFNEQLKRKGLFVDGMVANFGSHDWGVIQIGTEVQQIITTTGRGYIMLNNNLTDEEFWKKCIDDTAHLLTNFEYRSRGVLVTLPPYIHSHPTKMGDFEKCFRCFGSPIQLWDVGTALQSEQRLPINRNLGGANGSGSVGTSTSQVPNKERTMAGSAGPSTSNDTGRDRTMAGRWGPSTPPDMGRDRTSEENRGPQAFQNVNRDGTWDTNCMEQSTSQPVDRVRVFKRKLSENDRSFTFQDQTAPQNWNENMAGSSTNAFGECWRDSVTQRGNPELIPKYISAAIIGSQVDKLSRQIEDYYEFHQQIDEETERKQRVFKIIKDAIKERKVWYPELTTASVTGSSSTQLAAFESDFDLTFATTKPLSIEKKLEILRGLQHVFGRREFDFYNIDIIPSNRVPVLEMKYMEKGRRRPTLNIDITIGNDKRLNSHYIDK
uniref:Uncharacterized protein n=1 Tax=Meloidogyne enterolobii TaxID=390850 RepID=A0A6V7WSI8_MELEN|nr:unnamed protein product [Meloidogyne enterolobii]